MSEIWYPTSFEEQHLAGDIRITVDDIADYSYPPGRRKRYTTDGWRKAVAIGIAIVEVAMAADVLPINKKGPERGPSRF